MRRPCCAFLQSLMLVVCLPQPAMAELDYREAWLDSSDPTRLIDESYEQRLDQLELEASLEVQPWTGYYWPDMLRGLSYRWAGNIPHLPLRPSRPQIMSQAQYTIDRLSPAEKYDLYLGRYDYPLTSYELKRTQASSPSWWGLCHGWAPASIAFAEPQSVELTNPDGLRIKFYASDVKALLSFAQQYQREHDSVKMLALRCNEQLELNHSTGFSVPCRDVNPGSFHLVLAHWLGKKKMPLIMDINQGNEVWNVPVVGYETQVLETNDDVYENAARGTAQIVTVQTKVSYIAQVEPHHDAIGNNDIGQLRQQSYKYLLEIDKKGRIRGGEWVTRGTPDFLWFQTPFRFSGFFQKLESIYNESIRSR